MVPAAGAVITLPAMATFAQLGKAQYETLAAFRYELRRFLHFSEAAAQAAGISPQQHQALLAIKGFPGREQVTVGELAERLQLRHHSVVGLVDRLVAEKLVARSSAKTDRRQVLVQLTSRGEKTLERLTALHHEELQRVGPELGRLLASLGNEGRQAEKCPSARPGPGTGRVALNKPTPSGEQASPNANI